MELIGYILATLIGLSLGLMGSGGSILTVPLLVYAFGIDPIVATSYSLIIVGLTSGIGSYIQFKKGNVNLEIAFSFGLVSMVTVFLIRKFVLPIIPPVLFEVYGIVFEKAETLMFLFALLMVISALFILLDKKQKVSPYPKKVSFWKMLGFGLFIGLITGFLGAGGGFLIVPTLLLFFRTSMKTAGGTSLAVITINTLIGTLGDWGQMEINWYFLLNIMAITLIGLLIGLKLASKIQGNKLAKLFGWFLLVIASFIIISETLIR